MLEVLEKSKQQREITVQEKHDGKLKVSRCLEGQAGRSPPTWRWVLKLAENDVSCSASMRPRSSSSIGTRCQIRSWSALPVGNQLPRFWHNPCRPPHSNPSAEA